MPFAGDVTSTANGTLALSAIAAILYGFMLTDAPSWRRTVAKAAPVLLLAVLAFVESGPWLLGVALLASAAGDAALAQEGERPFLTGLAAFLLAHLLYIVLFVGYSPGLGIFAAEPWRLAVGGGLLVFVAWMMRMLLAAPLPRRLRLPIKAYVVAITGMGLAAVAVPGIGVAAGAALFILSDAALASRSFLLTQASAHFAAMGYAVWILYYCAQLLLTLAFLV